MKEMAKHKYDLVNLDVEKLCQELTVQELQGVVKALDAEIENRRSDLRKVVGDKYKDILTASEVINDMKETSSKVVESIDKIIKKCDVLPSWKTIQWSSPNEKISSKKNEERVIMVQIMLLMVLKNQIWMSLQNGNCNLAAQLYLLAQHVHTGLKLLKEDVLCRLPIIKRLKSDIDIIRNRILTRLKDSFQSTNMNSEEASSFLVAMVLLENQELTQLLNDFLEYRKIALKSIINDSYDTTRAQVIAMVQCLLTTVLTVYDNFVETDKRPQLLRQKLEEIILDSSPYTLSKVELPPSRLLKFTPEIVKTFRPKTKKVNSLEFPKKLLHKTMVNWLNETDQIVKNGLENQLKLLINIKSLHYIREEVLKEKLPDNWKDICLEMNFPVNFSIWFYFFEGLITTRAEELVTKNVHSIANELQNDVTVLFKESRSIKESLNIWEENDEYSNRPEDVKNTSLFMKINGYNDGIMNLCRTFDHKFSEIHEEINLYLYKNSSSDLEHVPLPEDTIDRKRMETHLKKECDDNFKRFISFLNDTLKIENPSQSDHDNQSKLLIASRILRAIISLCPNLKSCCTIDGNSSLWDSICGELNQKSLICLKLWVEVATTQNKEFINSSLNISNIYSMLQILPKWEAIEIENENETDDTVVKSQIKVPSRPSVALEMIFNKLSETLNELLPYTLPKEIHLLYIEKNLANILERYEHIVTSRDDLNQVQALQFLFDVKYLTMFAVPKGNTDMHHLSQKICDQFRSKVDPFDLDILYKYLQNNVKFSVLQTQVIFGCLLPSTTHLANIGTGEKKEQESEPSIITFSVPASTTWFPLLPVTAPTQKVLTSTAAHLQKQKSEPKSNKLDTKSSSGGADAAGMVRSGAAALFGAMANEWFS